MRLSWVPVAVTTSLAIAACGSSSNDGSQTKNASQAYAEGLDYSKCMRAHGVSNFPDPSGGGGQFRIAIGSGINPSSPSFQTAQSACKHFLPNGGQPTAQASAQAKARLLQISECMRAHGISGFPDPQSGSPPSSPAGYSAVMGTPGGYLAIPSSINVNSPAFKQAAAACNFGPKGAGVPKAIGSSKVP